MTGSIRIEALGPHVRRLAIDNPPMNALGAAMRARLAAALDEAEADTEVRALILTGSGRAFCSGEDLKDRGAEGEDTAGFAALLERVEQCRPAVIAAVNGWCVGGGFELAACCDIRIASTDARFVCAGVNVGLMASAVRLPRLIGLSRAKAMLLTGEPHDAATAERYGLVTAVHAPEALAAAAETLAARIASRAPLSVEATKRVAHAALALSPAEVAQMQQTALAALTRSDDHKEAVAAFREKRQPAFKRR